MQEHVDSEWKRLRQEHPEINVTAAKFLSFGMGLEQ